ncbi:MAG: pilus assembly protein [Alphaproteobacteria bacterium]|nr:pilus assembly protein [Alphaproteobacteria bacterium]MBV9418312.1 pilus assembly protein [Alphaproteobacteria bacterium]MBV9540053.1 pilus assembly protein [Alphaproteobacteria bacterium]
MLNLLQRFGRASGGLAAVEFAMLAPVLVAFLLGSIELTDALACKQKVNGLASTAADLIAQEKAVATADLSNVFSAVSSIVYPYPTNNVKIVITSLVDNGSGGAKVAWSCAQNTSARTVNSTVTVPAGVIATSGSVILAEITYPYTSTVAKYLAGTTNMTSTFYARPRRATTITGPSSCP